MAKKKRRKKSGCGCTGFFAGMAAALILLIVLVNTPYGEKAYNALKNGDFGISLPSGIELPSVSFGNSADSGTANDTANTADANDKLPDVSQASQDLLYASSEICRFDFIDIGQGDSSLITTPNGSRILIDTGLAGETQSLLKFLESSDVDSIDYLILSHPHNDHIGAASEVLTTYDVKTVIMPNASVSGVSFELLLEKIAEEKANGCKVYSANPGDYYTIDGCNITILGPISVDTEELNNTSIIMTVNYRDFTALYTGDAEAEAEAAVLADGASIDCELLKVGHHGSSTSSSREFLSAATPEIAVISCEKNNSYGHPHGEVITALDEIGAQTYITAENGCVSVLSDGKSHTVVTER